VAAAVERLAVITVTTASSGLFFFFFFFFFFFLFSLLDAALPSPYTIGTAAAPLTGSLCKIF
jgi:hypothetical protein